MKSYEEHLHKCLKGIFSDGMYFPRYFSIYFFPNISEISTCHIDGLVLYCVKKCVCIKLVYVLRKVRHILNFSLCELHRSKTEESLDSLNTAIYLLLAVQTGKTDISMFQPEYYTESGKKKKRQKDDKTFWSCLWINFFFPKISFHIIKSDILLQITDLFYLHRIRCSKLTLL